MLMSVMGQKQTFASPPRHIRITPKSHFIRKRPPTEAASIVCCYRQPGGDVRIVPQPVFLPLAHPGGTVPLPQPVFLPLLKPCGEPPPPPGPFAEAIVAVETANATDRATMVAVRGRDLYIFFSRFYYEINVPISQTFPNLDTRCIKYV